MRTPIIFSFILLLASTSCSARDGHELSIAQGHASLHERAFDGPSLKVRERLRLRSRSLVMRRNGNAENSPQGSPPGSQSNSASSTPRSGSSVASEPQTPGPHSPPGQNPRPGADTIGATGVDPGFRERLLRGVRRGPPRPPPERPHGGPPMALAVGAVASAATLWSGYNSYRLANVERTVMSKAHEFASLGDSAQKAQHLLHMRKTGQLHGPQAEQGLRSVIENHHKNMKKLRHFQLVLHDAEEMRKKGRVSNQVMNQMHNEIKRAYMEDAKLSQMLHPDNWDGKQVGFPQPEKESHGKAKGKR